MNNLKPYFPAWSALAVTVLTAAAGLLALHLLQSEKGKPSPYFSRNFVAMGNVLAKSGDPDAAMVCYKKALHVSARPADVHAAIGALLAQKGQIREAISEYHMSMVLAPLPARDMNNLAWILATHPNGKLRDGAGSLRLAILACKLRPDDPACRRTLAASYAETGDFAKAISNAQQGRSLAISQGNTELANSLEKEGAGYEKNVPFRDASFAKPNL